MTPLFVLILIIVTWILWQRTGKLRDRVDKLTRQNDQLYRMLETRGEVTPPKAESVDTSAPAPAPPPKPSALADDVYFHIPVEDPDDSVQEGEVSEKKESAPVARTAALTSTTGSTIPGLTPPVTGTARKQPAESDFSDTITTFLRRIGPDPDMGWEKALGTYWLPRIGGLFVAVGIVLFLAIALPKIGPGGRVALAYTGCVALLGGAWRLEGKYPAYARVLYGVGMAGTYFVTYATHYVPFAKIFDSPVPTLGLLAAVVVAWTVVAQIRRSSVVAVLTTFLGHFTIAVGTFTVEEAAPYAVVGIAFLSLGSAFFLLRNRWYYVAFLGLAGSYLNHFFVIANSESAGTTRELVIGLTVLGIYFIIYALAELFSPDDLRRRRVPVAVRTGYVTLNSAAFFSLGMIVVSAYGFTEGHRHLLPYILAAALLAIGFAYLHRRAGDPVYNAYITKAVTVLTIGLAIHFDGNTLTTALALEVVALLVAARRSGLLVTRLLAFGAGSLAFSHALFNIADGGAWSYAAEGYWGEAIPALLVVLAFWAATVIYQRTDWEVRSPAALPFGPDNLGFLWQLDLVARPADTELGLRKPLDGLLMPHLYSAAGVVICMGYITQYIEPGHRMLAAALVSALLVGGAWGAKVFPFAVGSFPLTVMALVAGTLEIVDGVSIPVAIAGLTAMAVSPLFCEPRYLGKPESLALHRQSSVPYMLYGIFFFLLAHYLTQSLGDTAEIYVIAAIAVLCAPAIHVLHHGALAWSSVALLLWAQALWHFNDSMRDLSVFIASVVLAAIAVGADRYYILQRVRNVSPVVIAGLWLLVVHLVYRTTDAEWHSFFWSLAGAGFLGYTLAFASRPAGFASAASVVGAALYIVGYAYDFRDPGGSTIPLVAGFAAPAAMLVVYERLSRQAQSRLGINVPASATAILVSAGTILAVLMLERVQLLAEFFLTISWAILGVFLFGLAILFREKTYRFAGLAVLLLASLRVIAVDTRELEALYKVLAWGGLGVILLALGFGYVKAFASDSVSNSESENQTE